MSEGATAGGGASGPAPDREHGRFDPADYADELAAAPSNHDLGTSLWFENDHVRVFEVRLDPGARGPFHVHDRTYFWTVVEPGRGLQRFADGTFVVRDYALGDTRYLVHSREDSLVHDLENVGATTLRFVTVELKR
ncbi:MAG TPA: cupin domain-containing protein [Actinomycetota bacterium]|nr:cupin domain-containing protein [Actinomycetota bacterium]